MKIKLKFGFTASLIGGILMGLTTAPVNAWPLAWIALIPLWMQLKIDRENSFIFNLKSLIFNSLLWGIGYHGIALFWITGIHPMTWLGVPWWPSLAIALFCWIFITLWGAALVIVWATIANYCSSLVDPNKERSIAILIRISIGTALWCLLETLWSSSDLWWTSLSYTQSPHNLAILHLGQISGPNTVTAAIVAFNGLIAELVISDRSSVISKSFKSKIILISPLIFCLLLHMIGFWLYSRPLIRSTETALKVGIIQGNIPNQIKFDSQGWNRAIEGYTTGYRILADRGVDAVLIPETALPFVWTDPDRIPRSFYSAVLEKGAVAWVGGFGQQGSNLTNSLFTITGDGKIFSRYDKVKLVPLGEYIPFEEYLGRLIDKLSPLDAHLVHGKSKQVFETPFNRAIVGICYDSAFSELFRRQAANGGQFILSASNDAHYKPAMAAQHHAQDIMRAIESDRWAVRATNTGYSAIVDPHGRTKWLSKINTYELHAATIYRRQSQPLYVRWGDWLTPLLSILAALTAAWQYSRQTMNDRS